MIGNATAQTSTGERYLASKTSPATIASATAASFIHDATNSTATIRRSPATLAELVY